MDLTRTQRIAGGLALAGVAVTIYAATRPVKVPVGPALAPGSTQTAVVQAPAGTTTAGLQTALQALLGTVQVFPFNSIPLALEDPNAATLWLVATSVTQPTLLQALNNSLSAQNIVFLGSNPPTVQFTPTSFQATVGTKLTIKFAAPGASQADAAAYLAGMGLTGGTPTQSGSTWTATVTPAQALLLNLAVTYGGQALSFTIQSVT